MGTGIKMGTSIKMSAGIKISAVIKTLITVKSTNARTLTSVNLLNIVKLICDQYVAEDISTGINNSFFTLIMQLNYTTTIKSHQTVKVKLNFYN